jgi:hypothetical protein
MLTILLDPHAAHCTDDRKRKYSLTHNKRTVTYKLHNAQHATSKCYANADAKQAEASSAIKKYDAPSDSSTLPAVTSPLTTDHVRGSALLLFMLRLSQCILAGSTTGLHHGSPGQSGLSRTFSALRVSS